MFTAVSAAIAGLALLWWWLQKSPAALARIREETERAGERPDHERARERAEIESDISRWQGMW